MQLLDTTLRDGSYVINFGFDGKQTADICLELDEAGVDFIEVGHGVGLNASNKGQGEARETDETYMAAASGAVKDAKWGMFAIPGICDLEHLDACIDFKMGFLRFGVSIDAYKKAVPFIEKAKAAGIIACVNFMKSYSRPPIVFEEAARYVASAGADYVYIVDSAGNMVPKTVRQYCERIKDLPFGFHGHNNLGLAVANALEAEACGAALIDASLQGMGRCTGNTMTEHFVALMHREGKLARLNLMRLLDAAEEHVRPLLSQVGHDSVDLVCGYSGFHSSYMHVVRRYALKYDVDPRLLIIAVCQESQSEAPDALVEQKAMELKGHSATKHHFTLSQYYGHEQENL
ncbi:4-hydroxy-2-oxovalerate aldolase [Rhizobium leguminosarum]|uniref:4-hydroxy-2-oxovalerate aldolase n=1 Tax=Rhizobium ruizarguesonis TaxID=2081791 RepID=UPI00102F8E8F|nr:4-hydroxy-2-oxovalerate aldolase [Rhizobium ruizarguesonis]NEI08755.1 4-hydroxy-2-oxovalerate aldolase [Rhizobium ruizarguesonis]TBB69488.1 4-hydroxy-2-oxovalerate aldolase [Rhizobium ruizarguesonis]